jgi:hypothetical protein
MQNLEKINRLSRSWKTVSVALLFSFILFGVVGVVGPSIGRSGIAHADSGCTGYPGAYVNGTTLYYAGNIECGARQ